VLVRRVTGMSRGFGDRFVSRIQELGCTGLVMSGDFREGPVLGGERAADRPPGRGVLVRRGEPRILIQADLHDEDATAASARVDQ
jgi:S-DNA-T family DNA segregation ATPase FtsK/SpoIIIE